LRYVALRHDISRLSLVSSGDTVASGLRAHRTARTQPLCHHPSMLDDPGLDPEELREAVRMAWGIAATGLAFMPGHDMQAASYRLDSGTASYFLKVRFGPVLDASLEVPSALSETGVRHIPVPVRTNSSALWDPMGDRSLLLYPFIHGRSAMQLGLTDDQWVEFGQTLRAVHNSGLAARFAQALPVERFDMPAARAVAQIRDVAEQRPHASPAGRRLAEVYRQRTARIDAVLARAEELGGLLRERRFERVLCHADIHANNILVSDRGEIHLVDWDSPMIAPRERDLLFVIGSTTGRRVEPHEEARFFQGYGAVEVDRHAIVYYRYERFLQDLAEFGRSVFLEPALTEAARHHEVDLVEWYFGPDGLLATAEEVTLIAADSSTADG
jgi:spectinomycin phosphotransferase